jgi:hypothetical protein
MWPFKKDPCVREGQWVGRVWDFFELYEWDLKRDITSYELAVLTKATITDIGLSDSGGYTGHKKVVPSKIHAFLNPSVTRHLKLITEAEFDRFYNPDMKYDQDAQT